MRTKSFFGTREPSRCVAELRTILRFRLLRLDVRPFAATPTQPGAAPKTAGGGLNKRLRRAGFKVFSKEAVALLTAEVETAIEALEGEGPEGDAAVALAS